MEKLLIASGIIIALIFIIWLGLTIQPKLFPAHPGPSPELKMVPLPSGLPAPVERFYRKIYGDQIPVIESAIITGRAAMSPFAGVKLPTRFRFIHDRVHGYRHYFEATFFGIPFFIINEHFVDGESYFKLPFGIVQHGPKINQAANLGMWAERLSLPAIFLTDPRVRWDAVDNDTALLVVPFETGEERFVVRFDPATSLVRYTEVMRYRDVDSKTKSLWITSGISEEWGNGFLVKSTGAATWLEDGKPWAFFTTETIQYNLDVSEYIKASGQ